MMKMSRRMHNGADNERLGGCPQVNGLIFVLINLFSEHGFKFK